MKSPVNPHEITDLMLAETFPSEAKRQAQQRRPAPHDEDQCTCQVPQVQHGISMVYLSLIMVNNGISMVINGIKGKSMVYKLLM